MQWKNTYGIMKKKLHKATLTSLRVSLELHKDIVNTSFKCLWIKGRKAVSEQKNNNTFF